MGLGGSGGTAFGENYDLDIRVGEVREPHPIAHRIAESSRILCAAPAYVERRGQPRTLDELAQHDCCHAKRNSARQ